MRLIRRARGHRRRTGSWAKLALVAVPVIAAAAGLAAANTLYTTADKDGSTIAAFTNGSAMEPLFGNASARYDAQKFNWLGSIGKLQNVCATWHHSEVKTIAAARATSDEMLLESIAKGNRTAMHTLYSRHNVRVFRFILRMVRDTTTAEDLVSQVFLDVWRTAGQFEGRAQVSTWLLSIARFKALSSLRGRTYETIDQDDVAGIVDDADTPEVALDRKETNAILRACIDKLSPAHREIIDLVYYHEQSIAEASVIVGIPHATVKSRMFYARKQLARILLSAGFEGAAVRTSADTAREARPSRGSHLKLRAGPSPISNPLENTIGTKWTYQGLRRMSDA